MSKDVHEYVTYRIDWVFKIGTIGDSEGRTWAKDLIEEKHFASKELAEAYRNTHPDLHFDERWKNWKTKNSYGQFGIYREQVLTPCTENPKVAGLLAAADAAMREMRNNAGHVRYSAQVCLSAALSCFYGMKRKA